MTCPYCVLPIQRGDQAHWHGRHKAHDGCQKYHEEHGLPYLLPGGDMLYHGHVIRRDAADALLQLFARHVGELRRKKLMV